MIGFHSLARKVVLHLKSCNICARVVAGIWRREKRRRDGDLRGKVFDRLLRVEDEESG